MATNNIKFRGEINKMSAAYFCRELESLPPRSSTAIYIHTPGGDVYAGGEMVIAFREACKRGCKFTLELGSLCASMGASLLAAARASGCKAVAHVNSEVMFHGCWAMVVGGADALTDQAKAMKDFNECVKADLRKCGIDDVDEWFAADRQKWLNAHELVELGLVDGIDEETATDADLKSDAVKIAAKYNHKETPKMDEPKNEVEATPVEETPAAVESPADPVAAETPAAPAEDPAPAAQPDAEAVEAKATALANQRFAGLQAKHEKMICDIVKTRDAALKDLADAKAEATSLKAEVEKLNADLAGLRDQLAQSEQNRESIVVAALEPTTELPTMEDGLAACKTLAERAEFLRAGNFKR